LLHAPAAGWLLLHAPACWWTAASCRNMLVDCCFMPQHAGWRLLHAAAC
jgi:hypothetical protein